MTTPENNPNITRVDPDRVGRAQAGLDERVRLAIQRQEHVWIVTVAHTLSDALAHRIADGEVIPDGILLDGENLAHMGIGCYLCEEPLTGRAYHRRCRGDVSGLL